MKVNVSWDNKGRIFLCGCHVLAFIYNDTNVFNVVIDGQLYGPFKTKKEAQEYIELEFGAH